ncbi:MAG TPA: response regulator [Vicinamibacterales bacterium]|nr:response regulator [Vicinamibacterales bacterium]
MQPLRALLVEDNEDDAELIVQQLRRDGFEPEWHRVDCRADYLAHLSDDLDIILSDYTLPQFDVATAMHLLHERQHDVPFIVISGTIGEERAVEVLRQGAADYLLKDRLQRLGRAVNNAMQARTLLREYRQVQQQLRDSEERYRLMFEQCPLPTWVWDLETGRFLAVNEAAVLQYGYSTEEFLSMRILDICLPEEPGGAAFTQPRPIPSFERGGGCRHKKKDGSDIEVEIRAHDLVFKGRPSRLVVAQDVTERRRAEEALLKHQQRTQFALKAGGIGIWDWDAKTAKSHWSETLEHIHGIPPFTFAGTMEAFLDYVYPEDRHAVQTEIARALAERRDASLGYRTVWPDGSVHLIVGKGRFSRDDAGNVIAGVGIGMDVTERRELETQLLQAQKMDAIGQLAGGIAHDFNNLLTAILGYAELLAPVLQDQERHRKDLEQIRKAATRATLLTGQLLAFSRRQMLQPAIVDLNVLVTDAGALLRRLIPENIELSLRLDPELGRTKADAGQIEQVIVNLAINARDAMPSGGSLVLQTMNVDVDDHFFLRHGFANEGDATRFVVLSVSDTGFGIDPVVKKRIFEPFFTTKPKGKGTGLGLATVYGIVKQSGGSIWVYSEPGQGATFKVYLPRTDEAVPEAMASPAQSSLRGTETILLVEDEEGVRLLSRALLERQGYRVIEAAGGEQAMRLAAAEPAPIDLLVTDVVMPGPSGPELFEHLAPLRPQMQVLFLSGYTDEAMVKRGVLKSGTSFLQKPFTATALSRKVRELLDARAGDE